MVKSHKAFIHSVVRLFKEQFGRFLALALISTIGVGFISGLGPIEDKLKDSVSASFREEKVPDLVALSSADAGFSSANLDDVAASDLVSESQSYFFLEKTDSNDKIYRVYSEDLSDDALGKFSIVEGTMPTKNTEVAIERKTNVFEGASLGDKITLSLPLSYTMTGVSDIDYEVTVTAIVKSPLFMYSGGAKSYTDEDKDLSNVFYFSKEASPFPSSYVNGINILLSSTKDENVYDKDYQSKAKDAKETLLTTLGSDETSILTLEENDGAKALGSYAEKVANISVILSIFFIAIVALVIANTLARLVEEDRKEIACYKSLGFYDVPIFFKYELFAFLSVATGALLGHFLISNYLIQIIYAAFSLSFLMPTMVSYTAPFWGLSALALAIIVSVLTTFFVLKNYLREKPSELLKTKTPKAGKTLLIEHWQGLWKRIPFSRKNTIRNLFRNKLRLIMTVVTVAGSVTLLVASCGLLSSAYARDDGSSDIISSVSYLLLVCSLALSVLVLYNLTNISLSERKRDIATLMVLGYKNNEVCAYLYREILVMVILGTILGLPCGVGFSSFVFAYVDYGSLADVKWFYYFLIVGAELLASGLVDLLLYPKITRTDMNGSLKAVE